MHEESNTERGAESTQSATN